MKELVKKAVPIILVLLLAAAPFAVSTYAISVMTLILIYMAMGQMWNLMGGYAGLLSLGMQTFVGIGGYSLTVFSVQYGVDVYAAVLLGGVISTLFALLVSPVLFRMKGVHFAVGSWIIAETLMILFSNWGFVGYAKNWGISSVYGISKVQIYYTASALGVGAVAAVYALLRSRTGLALMAMRDNPTAAEALGVHLYRAKMICFLISAFVTGIAGGVMYMVQAYIKPDTGFSVSWTIAMTFIVIIGGMGTIEGPVIGAALYVLLTQLLYGFPGMSMMILGVIAVAVIMAAPKGIMGVLYEKTGFRLLDPRHGAGIKPKSKG